MPRQFPDFRALSAALWLSACTSGGLPDSETVPRTDAGAGAADASEATSRRLVDNAAWRAVSPSNDPFFGARDDDVPCPETEWGLEELYTPAEGVEPAFEVHTQVCNYLTVEQPLRSQVRSQDRVTALFWHTQLTVEEGEAYAALAIGGSVVWESTLALPAVSASRPIDVVANESAPEGALVQFHVHNHGQNTWKLADLVATTPSTASESF